MIHLYKKNVYIIICKHRRNRKIINKGMLKNRKKNGTETADLRPSNSNIDNKSVSMPLTCSNVMDFLYRSRGFQRTTDLGFISQKFGAKINFFQRAQCNTILLTFIFILSRVRQTRLLVPH